MRKLTFILVIILTVLFNQCKEHKNIIYYSSKNSKLDSLSQEILLPYGREEIVKINFPTKWMCGGGYLEKSLKKLGYNDEDSIKYAQAYFSIIEFNRNLDTISPIKLDLDFFKKIPDINFENSDFLSVLKLPDVNDDIHVYGVNFRNGDTFFNPCYFTISNNEIVDFLTIYEKSRWSIMEHKSCFIDTNYIFHVRYFTNIDGYEVTTGEYEKYKINLQGKFVKID
jgi:hypothetical protein